MDENNASWARQFVTSIHGQYQKQLEQHRTKWLQNTGSSDLVPKFANSGSRQQKSWCDQVLSSISDNSSDAMDVIEDQEEAEEDLMKRMVDQARTKLETDMVMYRPRILAKMKTGQSRTAITERIGCTQYHTSSIEEDEDGGLVTLDGYVARLLFLHKCRMCGQPFTLTQTIGRFPCNGFAHSHTASASDAAILKTYRHFTDISSGPLNPFESGGLEGNLAAFFLMPLAVVQNSSSQHRTRIAFVPASSIVARYDTYEQLWERPVIWYARGTKLGVGGFAVSDRAPWGINIARLYTDAFANSLDIASFEQASSELDDGDEDNERWTTESRSQIEQRRQYESLVAKHGRLEKPLFEGDGGPHSFVSQMMTSLQKNPATASDMRPRFVPFIVVARIATLTRPLSS